MCFPCDLTTYIAVRNLYYDVWDVFRILFYDNQGYFLLALQATMLCLNEMYSVSQKKTSPTFLAVTRESIVGFS